MCAAAHRTSVKRNFIAGAQTARGNPLPVPNAVKKIRGRHGYAVPASDFSVFLPPGHNVENHPVRLVHALGG